MNLSITKDHKNPPGKANTRIEPKRATRRHTLHHGEKRRRNDDITRPAGNRVHHRSQRADLEREEFGTDPGDGGYACGEESYVDDYHYEEEDAGPVYGLGLDGQRGGDGDPIEGD